MKDKFYFLKSQHHSNTSLLLDDVGILVRDKTQLSYLKIYFLKIKGEVKCYKNEVESFDLDKTGDKFKKKVCDRCFRLLDTEQQFEKNRIKKDGLITKRPSCRSCRKIKNGVSIKSRIKKLWNETRPKNHTLFTCPICQKTTIVGITKFVLDHNHTNGEVRGWLCESCNTGIGRFDDDPKIVERAINWLVNQKN